MPNVALEGIVIELASPPEVKLQGIVVELSTQSALAPLPETETLINRGLN